MDDGRSLRNTDQLSRFLDGHVIRTSPFGQNSAGEKLYRRAERLVAALHLLTNHVSADEPVRSALRKDSLQLLARLMTVRDEMRVANSSKARSVYASLREIISLVRVLSISGHISIQNADVLIEALDELGGALRSSERTPLSENVLLEKEDFSLSAGSLVRSPFLAPARRVKDISDKLIQKDNMSKKDEAVSDTSSGVDSLNARSEAVLEVLRGQGALGIRDIASHLPEYSEKMIQRELATLALKKRVQKTGAKRWSRYSIVS